MFKISHFDHIIHVTVSASTRRTTHIINFPQVFKQPKTNGELSRWRLPPAADIEDENPKVRAVQLYSDPKHPFSRKAMLHINDAVVSHHGMSKYEDAFAQHFKLSDKRGIGI